jgi:crotonobetainyl-CoA:carnitine CoA-transferase CaiB-like acyl-CoA transferase
VQHSPSDSPLKGIRVLDLTSIVAGPMATLILAYLGAEIVKVERIDGGDDSRHMGPHMGRWSSVFVPLNRGKRSIALDISKPAGRDLILKLAQTSDVFIENFRGGKIAALGLGEDSLRAQNPTIIYASISAFGSDGPDALKPGYEALLQGRSGIMSVTGPGPDTSPVRAGVPIIDGSAGMWVTIGILAALFDRQKSGRGQKVSTSLLEAGVMLMFHNLLGKQFAGADPVPQGSRYPSFGAEGGSFGPYGAFETADGWIMIGVSSDRIFRRLCTALEHPEWTIEPRYLTNVLRVKNREELTGDMTAVLQKQSSSHWKTVFDSNDVPVSPIQNAAQVLNDPQVAAVNQLQNLELPGHKQNPVAVPRLPLHLSNTSLEELGTPPDLGEHGRDILVGLGYGDIEIEELIRQGVFRPSNSVDGEEIGVRSSAEYR